MSLNTNVLFLLTLILNFCHGYKVLVVFPTPGKSHSILGEGFVRHLLDAGHEVTYLTSILMKDPPPGLRQVNVSGNHIYFRSEIFDVKKYMIKGWDIQDYQFLNSVMHDVLYQTAQMKVVQDFMNDPNETFDAVILEWLYSELLAGFSTLFNCPLIWFSSQISHTTVLSLINEHLNPAYSVDSLSKTYSFNFWDRVNNLWQTLKIEYYRWLQRDYYNECFKKIFEAAAVKRGRVLPHFDDVRYNGSMMLGNTHYAITDMYALPQNYKHIGGYHIKNSTEPLPKDLQKVMDDSKNGVIYFSMGTFLKSSLIPEEIKRQLLVMFGKLKQTVVWKLEQVIPDLPKNVHVVTWAPQPSILAHPNTVLFITHGGLLSLMETLTAGVPIIGMPFFSDQYLNIERATVKGFGRRVDFDAHTPKNLQLAIKEIVEKPSYRERAKEWSAIFKKNIIPPGKELVYWVEYVIETKGASHLRSAALNLSWYKKLYLDLMAAIFIILLLAYKLFVFISNKNVYCARKKTIASYKKRN